MILVMKPQLLIRYQVGDKEQKATRIERYCQKHFELIIDNVGKTLRSLDSTCQNITCRLVCIDTRE